MPPCHCEPASQRWCGNPFPRPLRRRRRFSHRVIARPVRLASPERGLGCAQCAHWAEGSGVAIRFPVPVGADALGGPHSRPRRDEHCSSLRGHGYRPKNGLLPPPPGEVASAVSRQADDGRGVSAPPRGQLSAARLSDPRLCPTYGPPRASAPTAQTSVPRRGDSRIARRHGRGSDRRAVGGAGPYTTNPRFPVGEGLSAH